MSIAVLDVDGVVADVRHRLHHLDSRPPDWDRFFGAAATDPVLADGHQLALALAAEHEIVWLTGRPESLRTVTRNWLTANGLPAGRMLMRRAADLSPAAKFKAAAIGQLDSAAIAVVVDDDADVVRQLRSVGLPAILADWLPPAAGGQVS